MFTQKKQSCNSPPFSLPPLRPPSLFYNAIMVSMSSLCLSFVCSMSEGATGILDKGAEKYNLTSEPDDDLQVIHI